MAERTGKTLARMALGGMMAALVGCGGSAPAPASPAGDPAEPEAEKAPQGVTEEPPQAEKNGCPGKPGEKHACGSH
ncbi:hypothetical protein ACMHYB_43730 [Sorangium sp. So ce1128]